MISVEKKRIYGNALAKKMQKNLNASPLPYELICETLEGA
jgi:hypothetical protein